MEGWHEAPIAFEPAEEPGKKIGKAEYEELCRLVVADRDNIWRQYTHVDKEDALWLALVKSLWSYLEIDLKGNPRKYAPSYQLNILSAMSNRQLETFSPLGIARRYIKKALQQ